MDHSVFHLHTSAGYILLVVYVDDIVITFFLSVKNQYY